MALYIPPSADSPFLQSTGPLKNLWDPCCESDLLLGPAQLTELTTLSATWLTRVVRTVAPGLLDWNMPEWNYLDDILYTYG